MAGILECWFEEITARLHQLESVFKIDIVIRLNAVDEWGILLRRALFEVKAFFFRVWVDIPIFDQIVGANLVIHHRKSRSASEVMIVWEEESHET